MWKEEPARISRVHAGVRRVVGAALIFGLGCGVAPALQPVLVIPAAAEADEQNLVPATCSKGGRVSPMGFLRVRAGLAIRNPHDTSVFVSEVHALQADGWTTVRLAYDEPVFVPARETVFLLKTSYLAEKLEREVRVIYVDGWGHEQVATHPVGKARSLKRWKSPPRRSVASDERCTSPSPPELAPLEITVEPARPSVACKRWCRRELAIRLHNPNPHRVRVTDAWIDNPDGSAVAPARRDRHLHYVDARAAALVPYDIVLERAGWHTLRITYVDGWARQHVARKRLQVFVEAKANAAQTQTPAIRSTSSFTVL